MAKKSRTEELRLKGLPVSPGVAHAPIVVLDREELRIPARPIKEKDIPSEINRLENALVKTREQIQEIKERLSESLGEKDASIFDAHLLVVEDSSILEAVKKQLSLRLLCVEYLYHHLTTSFAQSMREVDDPYLRERSSDILDVGRRVLNNLMGKTFTGSIKLEQPSIVVAHDLTPSDTATLDRKFVLGFVTDLGSKTSHTSIMARSLNIPAVVGVKDASVLLKPLQEAILDGYEGLLIVNPSEGTNFTYGRIEERRHRVEEQLSTLRETKAVTKDNHRVIVSANVELPDDLELLWDTGAEGIGLHRTEFLFLNRVDTPSEEEQIAMYEKVIAASRPYPAILRTLDVGGDKLLEGASLVEDLNPFLGCRAIRYSLARPDLFRTQLRALCRAGKGEKIRILFPMIATAEEMFRARQMLSACAEELEKERVPFSNMDQIELGAMVEVPSIALAIETIIEQVDFLSIGTNDLIQYTLAVDRTNEKIAYLYQPTHPAIIRLIKGVVEVAHAHNKWVGVCGEMAGEVQLTPLLLGLGVDEFSMGSVFIPRVKRAVQALSYEETKKLVDTLDQFKSSEEILACLVELAKQSYPELFE